MKIRLPFALALIALCFGSVHAQTTKRLKVYIKIEARSAQNQDKIVSSLRSQLRPHRKLFLFVFPEAQKENNPDLTFTVKEDANGAMELLLGNNKSGIHYIRFESLANEIIMFSALEARTREVGQDQALEEFREGWEKAKRNKKTAKR